MSAKNVIPITETKEENHNIPIDFEVNKQMIDNTKDVMPICGIICGYLLLTLASIAWIIISSIALNQTTIADYREECSGSHIWISLLVMIIAVGLGMLDNWCGKRDDNNKRQPNILIMAIGLGSQIFSSIEVFNTCALNKLDDTLVYQLQFWMLIVVYSLYGIMILAGIAMCCICCMEEAAYKTPNKDTEETDNVFANLQTSLENLKKGETVIGVDNV